MLIAGRLSAQWVAVIWGVVGGRGAVGQKLLQLFQRKLLLASPKSSGVELPVSALLCGVAPSSDRRCFLGSSVSALGAGGHPQHSD